MRTQNDVNVFKNFGVSEIMSVSLFILYLKKSMNILLPFLNVPNNIVKVIHFSFEKMYGIVAYGGRSYACTCL